VAWHRLHLNLLVRFTQWRVTRLPLKKEILHHESVGL
jgi:hypothetical protein